MATHKNAAFTVHQREQPSAGWLWVARISGLAIIYVVMLGMG
jgi:hypothetical protein